MAKFYSSKTCFVGVTAIPNLPQSLVFKTSVNIQTPRQDKCQSVTPPTGEQWSSGELQRTERTAKAIISGRMTMLTRQAKEPAMDLKVAHANDMGLAS